MAISAEQSVIIKGENNSINDMKITLQQYDHDPEVTITEGLLKRLKDTVEKSWMLKSGIPEIEIYSLQGQDPITS